VFVAEGPQRVIRRRSEAWTAQQPAGALGSRTAVPGRRCHVERHLRTRDDQHLMTVLLDQRTQAGTSLFGQAGLEPDHHPSVLEAVHDGAVGRRLLVDAVPGGRLKVPTGGWRVRVVVDWLLQARGVVPRARPGAPQLTLGRTSGRVEVADARLGHVAARGQARRYPPLGVPRARIASALVVRSASAACQGQRECEGECGRASHRREASVAAAWNGTW
jgi:hypothetical protein